MRIFQNILKANLLLVCVLFAISCEEDAPVFEEEFSAENAALAAQTDTTVEGTLTILENGFEENEGSTKSSTMVSLFPDCTTIILQPNGDGTGVILLDFGSGCTLNNNANVSGVIRLEYSAIANDSRTITYTFQNYTYNNNSVEGGGTVVRQLTNANGNPQSTVNETINVSFPNSTITATRNGLRIAEWVEGVGSGTWTDNVYSITGNWDTTLTNGFERSGEVTQPLIRKLNCPYLVQGLLQITQDGFTGTIDFGDGTCDAQATLEINGQTYTIFL